MIKKIFSNFIDFNWWKKSIKPILSNLFVIQWICILFLLILKLIIKNTFVSFLITIIGACITGFLIELFNMIFFKKDFKNEENLADSIRNLIVFGIGIILFLLLKAFI
jgi:hypothetical protein